MFRYKADAIPISLFVSYFIVDLSVYLTINSIIFLLSYLLLSIVIKGFIGAWNHHHQHVLTFSSSWMNRLLEVVYGFQTGIV